MTVIADYGWPHINRIFMRLRNKNFVATTFFYHWIFRDARSQRNFTLKKKNPKCCLFYCFKDRYWKNNYMVHIFGRKTGQWHIVTSTWEMHFLPPSHPTDAIPSRPRTFWCLYIPTKFLKYPPARFVKYIVGRSNCGMS